MWPELNLSLNGYGFKEMLNKCQQMRQRIEDMGIPTDLTDEYFLMLRAGGYKGKAGMHQFKKDTIIDIVSADYRNISKISKRVNIYSKKLASS